MRKVVYLLSLATAKGMNNIFYIISCEMFVELQIVARDPEPA